MHNIVRTCDTTPSFCLSYNFVAASRSCERSSSHFHFSKIWDFLLTPGIYFASDIYIICLRASYQLKLYVYLSSFLQLGPLHEPTNGPSDILPLKYPTKPPRKLSLRFPCLGSLAVQMNQYVHPEVLSRPKVEDILWTSRFENSFQLEYFPEV